MHFSSLLSLFSLALPLFVSAEHDASRRHNALASRMRGNLEARMHGDLEARFNNARLTFYKVGLGACGVTNVDSDFIVALNSAQFGGGYPGPHCFETITITYQGKSTQAKIMDECPGCPWGGLDLSPGLFAHFAPLGTGVLSAEWVFNGGGNSGPPPPPPPAPKPSPTSQWTPPPSPTWSAPQSSWTSQKASSTYSSSSSQTSSKSSAPSATPTTVPTVIAPVYGSPSQPQNFHGLNAIVGGLGEFIARVHV